MSKNLSLINILKELLRWKKFLLINFFITVIFAVSIALILPLEFKSTASILPPSQSNILSSILPSNLTKGLTGALGSGAFDQDGETNKIISILNSRTLREKIIYEFDLMEKFESPTIEDALETLSEKISTEITDEGLIYIVVKDKTEFFHFEEDELETKTFVKVLNDYIISELDNTYTKIGIQKASYERQEIEKRYEQNKNEIRDLENKIKNFSASTGIISFPEQTQALIEVIADLETKKIAEEIKLSILKNEFESSSEISNTEFLINELNRNINLLKTDGSSGDSLKVLPPFSMTPEYGLQFARLQREYEVQIIIYEFLTQQYEQTKLQETKDTPSLQLIDLPSTPTKRSAPTRSIIVIAIVFLSCVVTLFGTLIFSLYKEELLNLKRELKGLNV